MKNKINFYYLLAFILFVLSTVGIILSFYHTESVQLVFKDLLGLKIHPSFLGGEIADIVFDPIHDDFGAGNISYPSHPNFTKGNLDLVSYSVHAPIYNANWSELDDFWQIVLQFRTGYQDKLEPMYNRTIYIYIGTGGFKTSSCNTLFEYSELVQFEDTYPWDIALVVYGDKGEAFTADGKKLETLEVIYSSDGTKVIVQLPLRKKSLHYLYELKKSYHYVLVGAYSPLEPGYLVPITNRKTRTSGGGSNSNFTPKIYDILFDGNQSDQLLSYDDENFTYATLKPVFVTMQTIHKTKIKEDTQEIEKKALLLDELNSKISSLKKLIHQENEKAYHNLKQIETPNDKELLELALLCFEMENYSESEKIFLQLHTSNKDNALYQAYLGSLESIKGANASVIKAVEAVNKGYVFLDKAVSLTTNVLEKARTQKAKTQEIELRIHVLLNRAGTSEAVPNNVFIKALQGAHDNLEVAELALMIDSPVQAIKAYLAASRCFAIDDKTTESLMWQKEAIRVFENLKKSQTNEILMQPKEILERLEIEKALLE